MGGEIVIRAAANTDIPAMAAIRAMEWESRSYWEGRIGGYLEGVHSPQEALAERASWVALSQNHIAGFIAGHRTRRFGCDGELQWLSVAPAVRGKGIAGQLVMVMLSWFRQHNMNRICVNVTSENVAARRVYAKQGAVSLKPGWMEWHDLRQAVIFSQAEIDR